MAPRMFGLEGEYFFAVFGPRNGRLDQATWITRLMELAKRRLVHLPGQMSGIFLGNGARFYLDCGKPEMTTPEVLCPWDACRYVKAGERILADLARQMARERSIREVIINRSNVCYGPSPTTWANHESYCHQARPETLPDQIIPHLVSRLIYTGGGGFNNRSAGLEFMISPRQAHLERRTSTNSQGDRGIFHEKNEPLCDRYQRLHVLCGEAVCSETSLWLRMGTTALVVAMIEAGLKPGDAVQLSDPVGSMRRFATDVAVSHKTETTDGRRLGAIEIQEHYLQQAEAHVNHQCMPPWAPQVCQKWRAVLQRLKQGPTALESVLDWAIKLPLYQRFAQSQQVAWESLEDWNYVLGLLDAVLRTRSIAGARQPVTTAVLAHGSPVADDVQRLTPMLERKGLHWDQFETVLKLRQQLFELDNRFGELSQRGIFDALDRQGVLDHHVDGVDNIEAAMADPPSAGRARIRGHCVQQFHGKSAGCVCDWNRVWDLAAARYLDLADPFVTSQDWKPFVPSTASLDSSLGGSATIGPRR